MTQVNASFAKARDVTAAVAELFRSPRRMKPSEAAKLYLRNERDAWDPALSPMMIEPLDLLASRLYTGIVFVGPARSSKTFSIVLGGITYVVTCAPGDTLVIQMSQDAARDFSRTEVDRVMRASPEMHARLSPRAKDDNTYDKFFRSGMVVKLGWPAISQLSSKTIHYVFITDYDRPESRDNVDGEGPMWDLAAKRIETYMSRGKCVAESSPGEVLEDGSWKPATPHEAPPVNGIFSLYNRGTRARWYWGCLHCNGRFQALPGIAPFNLPSFDECEQLVKKHDPVKLAEEFAHVACTKCGALHEMTDRTEMNKPAVWLHEGEEFTSQWKVTGNRRRSQIASYWLGGVAATYQRWDSMLTKYFQGVLTYSKSLDEEPLKFVINTDFCDAYVPRLQTKRRTPDQFTARLDETLQKGVIPTWARFILAAVDVQARSFRVNVYAYGAGLEMCPIERFSIEVSKRTDNGRPLAVDPAAYLEDWELLRDEVIMKGYPVEGLGDFKLVPRMVGIDSGGREGVTSRAYDFFRKIRKDGHGERVRLVKGDKLWEKQTAGKATELPRVKVTWPDSSKRSDRHAASRGDVPVLMINVNVVKDSVMADLGRDERGPGYVHLPKWLPQEFFEQMTAEVRNDKGVWENPKKKRNEDPDLHVYAKGLLLHMNADKINWSNPPEWARDPKERAARGNNGQSARLSRLEQLGKEQFDG